jgi:hypothetical protein
MSRKVYVNVIIRLVLNLDEGTEVDEILSDMDYDFQYKDEYGFPVIEDTEIIDYEIINLK